MGLRERLYRWWARDYPPLDGRLRAVVYLALLVLAWDHLFSATLHRVAHLCPLGLYQPPGIMQLVFRYASLADVEYLLAAIHYPLIGAWVFAALGLFGRVPLVLTALGVILFWGAQQSCAGTSHEWHLPLYVLTTCGLLLAPDRWSLDWYLARRFAGYPFRPDGEAGGDASGFARKLCLLLAVFTLFSAGITKLWQAGPAWVDGNPLTYYLEALAYPKPPFGTRLLAVLQASPLLVQVLSAATMVLELGSAATLFVPRLRWPFVIGAWAFHLGIWLLMLPRYFPQMACYLLLVDWRMALAKLGWRRPERPDDPRPLPPPRTQLAVVSTGSVVTLVLAITLLAQREYWPLSHIPMYSSYVSPDRVGNLARADYESLRGLSRVAASGEQEELPWATRALLAPRIRLAGITGECLQPLDPAFPGAVVERLLWQSRVTVALLDDLRRAQKEGMVVPSRFAQVERVLGTVRERVLRQEQWSQMDHFRLVFVEADGRWTTLARLDRHAGTTGSESVPCRRGG